jgi:hypothetical protein
MFVDGWSVSKIARDLSVWRKDREINEKISSRTYYEWMGLCRQVGWTIASNEVHLKTFRGKLTLTVELDETFVKSMKDGRGRPSHSSKIIIFGIYCWERKDGIFLRVPRYNKRTLLPIIRPFVHPETSVICTDSWFGIMELKGFFILSLLNTGKRIKVWESLWILWIHQIPCALWKMKIDN